MKIFLITTICFAAMLSGQTFQDIQNYASFIGKSPDLMEKFMDKSPLYKESKFGIENRVYEFTDYSLNIETEVDSNKITEIDMMLLNGEKSSEIWYSISSQMYKSRKYDYVEGYYRDLNKLISENTVTYPDLLQKLRDTNDLENIAYQSIFKDEKQIFYKTFVVSKLLNITISNKLND
ncbi:hypothetical protein U9K52_10045 [Chryseobacterium sp. MHB01]|uniref:hypothetical protein n=1 Tax=Chryseobacterium sp. MHB01 TaxID=3109433 RepID=UPI002B002E9C|nr:hypothetical protein [Chryseobacterium sp. MHB01]MEA1849254.1 hypothetical protein [Chryseobacterium sp. MHB01]